MPLQFKIDIISDQCLCIRPKKGKAMGDSTKNKWMTFVSFTCVIHCVVAPFLVMATPMLGHIFENIFIEIAVLLVSIACGIGIIYNGYCTHKKKHAIILFFLGASFWGLNTLLEAVTNMHLHSELLIIGTILVLVAYRINHKHKKKCCSSDHHH